MTAERAITILAEQEFWNWAEQMHGVQLGELFVLGGYCARGDPFIPLLNLAGSANQRITEALGQARFEMKALKDARDAAQATLAAERRRDANAHDQPPHRRKGVEM